MLTESHIAAVTLVQSLPWLRVAPPIIAIALAIIIKDVNFALLLAVFSGCLLLSDFHIFSGIETLCEVFVNQIANADHASVILFTVLLGAMIGLMNDSGGTDAVVGRIARYANTRQKGQVLTWLAGVIVFFDDYANTMLIGGSVRPLTDKLKISRAKLAFLIDATAAPIAGLALSTWTAFEIDQVNLGLQQANISANASDVFLATIPFRIYPIIAIIVVGVIAISGRDFGPMLAAERHAMETNTETQTLEVASKPGSVWTAVIPVSALILTVLALLWSDSIYGGEDWWKNVDAYKLLLISSLSASTTAVLASLAFGKMSLVDCSRSWTGGISSMIPAVIVLILAWAINGVCESGKLDTAEYIISLVGDSLRPEFLPAVAFLAAGAMAVSIGSSFTTMGLLVPMFIPLCWSILSASTENSSVEHPIFLATIGAILAGAIFGDHCSPISDTTVLSSAAAGCDHLQHVATQVPYAIVIAVSSVLFGYLPIGFGVPWWIALPLSTGVCVGVVLFLGKTPDERVPKKTTMG